MLLCGFQKTTLLDYPERIAATLFTGGCNFRCPFCHNKNLVISEHFQSSYTKDDIFSFLEKRKNILNGICITGGEPTLQPDLIDWITDIKALGYSVKLDTNGYKPAVLSELLENKLVDYIAMDIKNSADSYAHSIGLSDAQFHIEAINESISLIRNSSIDYEFRTTVVRQLHTGESLLAIANWIAPCKRYFLQAYRENDQVIHPIFTSYTKNEFLSFQSMLKPIIPSVSLRGIDGI